MGIKGNSSNINKDRRFGSNNGNTTGLIDIFQHNLERINGRMISYPIPSDITLWLKSDGDLTINNNRVVKWEDASLLGNDIYSEQTNFNYQPDFITSSPLFNGLPTLSFNSSGDNMETTNNNTLLNCSDGFTHYVVCKINSTPSTYNFLTTRTNGTSWTQGFGIFKYSGSWRFWVNNWNSTNTRVDLTFNNTSDVHIFKLHYDKINILGEIIGVDGSTQTKGYTSSVTNPSSSEGITLCDGNSTSYTIRADVSEVLFFNRPITSIEQNEIETYLINKYNI